MADAQPSLTVIPISLKAANAYVLRHHRHHGKCVGHKFSHGVIDETGRLRGVAITGRPVARNLDDGWTLEVNRLCTDGCPNACSALYAAARRSAFSLGYYRIITYILESEPGTSLKAAGWVYHGEAGGGSWSVPSRPREDKHPLEKKQRWQAVRANPPPFRPRTYDDADAPAEATSVLQPALI